MIGKSYAEKKITVDKETGRVRVQTINKLPSKTQQQFKDQCDLNKIMKQAKRTGELPFKHKARGYYMDHTVLPQDYQAALNIVIEGNDAFNNLPSETRFRFDNDPKKLLEFLADPKNHEEAQKLGIKDQKQEPQEAKSAKQQKADKKATKESEIQNDE